MDGGRTGSKPHLFAVTDYHRMTEAGVLNEDSRVELIQGQVIDMATIGPTHVRMVNRLTRLLVSLVGMRGIVSVQNPVRLGNVSEPQPDVTTLHPRMDEDDAGTPGPADVLLLIEVADSSLEFDRATKLPLYAGAGSGNAGSSTCRNAPSRSTAIRRATGMPGSGVPALANPWTSFCCPA